LKKTDKEEKNKKVFSKEIESPTKFKKANDDLLDSSPTKKSEGSPSKSKEGAGDL
jgi:hypothetical protein